MLYNYGQSVDGRTEAPREMNERKAKQQKQKLLSALFLFHLSSIVFYPLASQQRSRSFVRSASVRPTDRLSR